MSSPLKFNFKTEWFSIALILFLFSSLAFFYLLTPNILKQNSYLSVFLVPIISLFVYLFFLFLATYDLDNKLYQKYFKSYCSFRDIILALLALIQSFFILNIFNYSINLHIYLPLLIASLFFILYNFNIKFKVNIIGPIYTPILNQTLLITAILIATLAIIPKAWHLLILLLLILIIIMPFILFLIKRKKFNKSN